MDNASLKGHILSIGHKGRPATHDTQFLADEAHLEWLLDEFEIITQSWPRRRLLLYAHGGNISEEMAVSWSQERLGSFLRDQLYPLSLVWHTDPTSQLRNAFLNLFSPDRRGQGQVLTNRIKAEIMRPFGSVIWSAIKQSAEDASESQTGAMRQWLSRFKERSRRLGEVELHLLGYSAGGIFQVHVARLAHELGINIKSCVLWAPGCTTTLFKDSLMPLVAQGHIEQFALYTLTDSYEQVDTAALNYTGSVLEAVSEALEQVRHTPLLGLERFIYADAELRQFLTATSNVRWIHAPQHGWSHAKAHKEFDDDSLTIETTKAIMLGSTRQILNATSSSMPTATTGLVKDQLKTTSNVWALLIGINIYKSRRINPLQGCENDVTQMRHFLINQMTVPENQIRTLINEQATRDEIIQAFQDFLINNPSIIAGSQILIHYSGHGSQILSRSKTEPDGLDETIVVHDARTTDDQGRYIFDIPDKTLAAMLDQLAAAKGDHIMVILDCCHSGSGTRAYGPRDALSIRHVETDDRIPPPDLDSKIRERTPELHRAELSGWSVPRANHVLIAGCRDLEVAYEMNGLDGQRQGALSYYLLEFLRNKPRQASYADLHEYVAAKVNGIFRSQMPVCEGQRNREIFGGAWVERDPFIRVVQVMNDELIVSAGSLLPGLAQGAVLSIYSSEVRTRSDLQHATRLGSAVVTRTTPVSAHAKVIDDTKVSVNDRVFIDKPAYAGQRQRVSLLSEPPYIHRRVIEDLQIQIASHKSPFLELVEKDADLQVIANGNKLHVCNAGGIDLIQPIDIDENRGVVADSLEAIAHWRALLALKNESRQSRVQGGLRMKLLHCSQNGEPLPLTDDEKGVHRSGDIVLQADNQEESPQNSFVIEIENHTDVPVYPHVIILNPDYSVTHLYPEGGRQNESLRAHGTVQCGVTGNTESLRIYLTPDWEASQDTLLLIATTEPSELGMLGQRGLTVPAGSVRGIQSPLEELIESLSLGSRISGSGADRLKGADWGTFLLTYRVTRARQTTALQHGDTHITLGHGIKLTKPMPLEGEVTVEVISSAQDASLRSGDVPIKLPPGLASSSHFALAGISSARGAGSTGLVFTLNISNGTSTLVNAANPLMLDLRLLNGGFTGLPDDLLPVIFDGQDFLFVPNTSKTAGVVALSHLPRPTASVDMEPSGRDLFRAIRLFIFKKIGGEMPELGLKHVIEHADRTQTRVEPESNNFKSGDRVALFVHGFTSDTRWMTDNVVPQLRKNGLHYDHILAFDYESLGTSVNASAKTLFNALKRKCGFSPSDNVHLDVFAHSMGCLVSRCMIELQGGHEIVDRLVMAGPPNRGTVLAGRFFAASTLVEFLFDMLLNSNLSIAPNIADSLLKALDGPMSGLQDIQEDSPITQELANTPASQKVNYLVLAGIFNPGQNDVQQARLEHLAEKVLNSSLTTLFGEPNDLVIGKSSMEAVQETHSKQVTVKEIQCDHIHYFSTESTYVLIKEWANIL